MHNISIINEENILQKLDNETKEKIITPRNDYVFKRIFGRKGNENLLKSLLEAILNIKIKSLKLGESTELLPNEINEKEGILDVKTILEDGTKRWVISMVVIFRPYKKGDGRRSYENE